METFKDKIKLYLNNDTMDIFSYINIQFKTCPPYCYPMAVRRDIDIDIDR